MIKAKIERALERGKLWFLAPLSLSYKLALTLRHQLYDRGWIKTKKAPLTVVSVGNLVLGGTGKTQVVLHLAKQLAAHTQVAIVSRGYGSLAEKRDKPTLITPEMSAQEGGDEPTLLAARCKEALVIVSKDRHKGCLLAKQKGAKVVLLDDGLQHRRLARDFELIVVNGAKPYGSRHLVPWGNLRELPERLKTADVVLAAQQHGSTPFFKNEVGFTTAVQGVHFFLGEALPLKGEKVALFCAIAHPNRFLQTVESLGAKVVHIKHFPDHAQVTEKVYKQLVDVAKQKGAKAVLCTEKDYRKLKGVTWRSPLPLGYVQVALKITTNQTTLETLIANIKTKSETL